MSAKQALVPSIALPDTEDNLEEEIDRFLAAEPQPPKESVTPKQPRAQTLTDFPPQLSVPVRIDTRGTYSMVYRQGFKRRPT